MNVAPRVFICTQQFQKQMYNGRIEDLKPYGSVPGTEIGRYRRDC